MDTSPPAGFPDSLNPPPIEIPTDRDVTWEDIIAAGRNGHPFLWQLVKLVECGRMTREQALMRTVLGLSEARRRMMNDLIEHYNRMPARPIVLVPDQL